MGAVHFWTEVGRAESGHPWTGRRAGLGAARFNLRPGLAVRIRPSEGPATNTHTHLLFHLLTREVTRPNSLLTEIQERVCLKLKCR